MRCRKTRPTGTAAYALIDFLLTPAVNAKEVDGPRSCPFDRRARQLRFFPEEHSLKNPVLYPAARLADRRSSSGPRRPLPIRRAPKSIARFKSA